MLNFVENLLVNERGPMNDQDLTKTDYDPDRSLVRSRVSLSFSNKFSTKFSIVSNKLKAKFFKKHFVWHQIDEKSTFSIF
jgi:hypothetical protein